MNFKEYVLTGFALGVILSAMYIGAILVQALFNWWA